MPPLGKMILRRLLWVFPVAFGVVTMTFFSMGTLTSRARPARSRLATTPKAAASVGVAIPR